MTAEVKHTPGPWKAVKAAHGPIDIIDKRGRDVVTLYGGGVETESLALNANLIAAAPELLEALIHAAQDLESLGYKADSARAAIAKATGGQ